MNDAKPFASLSATLLARKGHAKPAMRPQSFHMVPGPAPQVLDSFAPDQDDLGWNDMGHDEPIDSHGLAGHDVKGHEQDIHPANGNGLNGQAVNGLHLNGHSGLSPVPIREDQPIVEPEAPPPVIEQQESLAREFNVPAAVKFKPVERVVRPRAAPGSKGKAAFTLRLDADRHFRLRLVCAVNHRSAQQIVTIALDEYLARQPDNASLASNH